MAGTRLAKIFNGTIVFAGVVCLGIALANLPKLEINPGYLAVIAFAIVVSPRMTLSLPRANYFLSFSDAVVFFTFVVFGGEHAIIVAFFEMFAHCFYLRRTGKLVKDWILLFNVALSVVVTSIAYVALLGFSSLLSRELSASSTRDLLVMLGVLSLAQFFASSLLAAAYQSLKAGTGIWETWKKECLIISLGQFAGAGLAGAFFKIMHNADPIVIGLAAISIGVLYLSYKQVIGEITSSIVQVEDVEREKAQIERTRRVEAEESAEKLSVALAKEEMANKALRKSERDFAHAALHDNLTGLANRNQFGDSLRKLIAEYKLDPSSEFQVLFLDIRSFKNINDTLGHTIGDKVLTIAAKRFVRMLDAKDIVARIGGDEFAIILRGLGSTAKAQKVARRIYQNITQPFSLSGNHISIDVNIGIAPCDTEYDTPEEILRDADIAMHYAKEKKNGLAVFTKELRDRFLERVRFEMDLRHAIDRNELACTISQSSAFRMAA